MNKSKNNLSTNATKRLLRDLNELRKSPIPGVSIASVNDNIFDLHTNIIIPEGDYEGLMLHVIINIPPTYPLSSPTGYMANNFPFKHEHHEHIHGRSLCNDYLSNFDGYFKSIDNGKIVAGSGWNPSITLKGLLMMLKTFFVDTDRSKPHKKMVDNVFKLTENYKCHDCGHTTKNPYPELPDVIEELNKIDNTINNIENAAIERAKMNLICSISKDNYFENPDIILGYPIHLNIDKFNRLWTKLIPEMICYEQYVLEIQKSGVNKLDNFNKINFKTASGQKYNNWLAIYISETHYQKNIQCIKNTISVISNGIKGIKENEFVPGMVIRVLPCLMNKMVVSLMNSETHESENAIFAFCHYLRLLMRMFKEYPELPNKIDSHIESFIKHRKNRNKEKVSDMGEFIIKLSLSKKYSYNDDKIKIPLLEEYFARQVFWINKKDRYIHKNTNIYERLDKTFSMTEISNKLLVFNLMMNDFFIFDGVEQKLDQNYY